MKKKLLIGVSLVFFTDVSFAMQCREVHWTKGQVINVRSAKIYGTRIQFPTNLLMQPKAGNSNLWDIDFSANHAFIKPNSDEPQGEGTTFRVFTIDGDAYDIIVKRSQESVSDMCVIITENGSFFNKSEQQALENVKNTPTNFSYQINEMQKKLAKSERDKDQAVIEALRRFRYHIYTRYGWDPGKGFASSGFVSDVYDDGRFTYIRVSNPKRGLMSVETTVGGKTAVVPTKYDDAFAMYTVNGVYPEFTLRMDNDKIKIKRYDSKNNGAF